ncbi:MAG: proline--tRNA ligase [Myxococcota bacterium]
MRFSKAFIPTIKEVPKDAVDASHVLLLRAGFIRMVGSGIYEMLPLGQRVLKKIIAIIREEMERSDAQEVLMPALLPASFFQETGRWDVYGDVLMRLKDRKGGDYHLGPTHEEIITDMVRREIRSYKQLPQILFQIQMKYRDEPRPRAGLMRCREFLMKDAYSFDVSEEKAHESYATMRDAYHRIFRRLGLDYRIVQADSGAIGGDTSAEFQILAQSGEDAIVACGSCEYAANVEIAEALIEAAPEKTSAAELTRVATPDTKSIEEVVAFFAEEGATAKDTIKSLVYVTVGEEPETVLALVRGDRDLNEIKLARYLNKDEVRLATDDEVKAKLGTSIGYVGPVDAKLRIIADYEVRGLENAIAGGGDGHHYRNVNLGRDFEAEITALRAVGDGDACANCGAPLKAYRGIEGGHIFVLGTRYSNDMKATFLDENGKAQNVVMGCYGIGVTRLMASAVEQNHDDAGIQWPLPIAPYHVIVMALGKGAEIFGAAEKIYESLKERGVEVLYDDRKERPGPKFKDAELIGVPIQVRVGRDAKDGLAELKLRTSGDGEKVPLDQVVDVVAARIAELKKGS